ncbi:phage portal protein [Microbacterium sp. NPDC058021]|uniref:phage portal protein n=1 Tax=Microbacterium sp. NPDC058021 TaxID=3346306 RepID=UPI0036D78124
MVIGISAGKLLAVHKPTYQAPTSLRISDDRTLDYAAIYRQHQSVRTVVDFLARNVAQLALHTFERTSDSDRKRITDHPFARMMRQPNQFTTGYRLMFSLVADRGIYDRALWVKMPGAGGEMQLVRIPPRLWTVADDDNWLAPTRFVLNGSKGKVSLDAEQVVYFRGYNPEDERFGLSPIESLRRILSEEYAAGQMREQVLRNGARVSGYITRPAGAAWSDTAYDRFQQGWRSQYQGQSATEAGGTPVLEDGMTFVPASHTAEDLQYIEARKLSREEAASAYHIPPPMVGILDHATFGNIQEQHKMLYQDTLGPILQDVQQEIALQLLRDFDGTDDLYSEFNMAEKLRGSFEEQAAQLQTSVGAPFLTRNEARARANLPRIEGGDDLVVPLNVLVGGQASPRDGVTAGGGGGQLPDAAVPEVDGFTPDEVVKLVNAVTALIRAGFDPSEALAAVGLDPIKHLGLLPVTIQKPVAPEGDVDETLVEEITKSIGHVHSKARPPKTYVAKATEVLSGFFARQGQVIKSVLGAKADAEWWDGDRWDRELGNALYALSASITDSVARAQLASLGVDEGDFDLDRTLAYLKTVAGANASSINAATRIRLEEALADPDDPVEAVKHVFDVATSSRAAQAGLTVATAAAGFASVEAVKQVQGTRTATKTWVVTSGNPRPSHASMAGETVPLDSVFSNGAKWPGDSSALDVDEVAGCSCDIEINFE